ncbi:MAG: hypothetical protein AUJ92_08740 [Armatimonadetes bacterium CG2_30_59_28]|nr:hypothetical protein [Armatimonadota bacterium]OIO95030.1 MAG: hypothetical protein AUJ92_08740 [Armatimonadetes bacterium CG2_30_59_28]PIU67509.1 MAG: hypothetical protein COS85_00340 [Armatimonadetes bacterium CG07_land_8_20_14_0_80_59_28]PIX39308.1 MAG: hypothetical protein COZ56_17990 [Armatimonadetes bacterium CG_4_8_14_3_um_filter_58_9]PIY48660.1 MAG: hypothetical protein COZ05_02575 [Armatimonadetes bacterium CG_4_10_14_3_um_filter_59_10]PJB76326.1 MAG: hypothetical protein CO095_027
MTGRGGDAERIEGANLGAGFLRKPATLAALNAPCSRHWRTIVDSGGRRSLPILLKAEFVVDSDPDYRVGDRPGNTTPALP